MKTVESRRYLLQTFRDQTPNMLAEEISPLHVQKWKSKSKAKAGATIAGRINHISGMFNWGIRLGLIKHNPVARMPRPTSMPREDFVPPSKFKKVIKACDSDQLRDLVMFLLDTGCRVTCPSLRSQATQISASKQWVFYRASGNVLKQC